MLNEAWWYMCEANPPGFREGNQLFALCVTIFTLFWKTCCFCVVFLDSVYTYYLTFNVLNVLIFQAEISRWSLIFTTTTTYLC